MQIWSSLSSSEQHALLARPAQANSVQLTQTVANIIDDVATQGDAALQALSAKFDKKPLSEFALSQAQLEQGLAQLTPELKQAIDTAYNNILRFHQAQKPQDLDIETTQGVQCSMHYTPLSAVGLYIPGGSAPLPSTVLMLGTPAQVAGCERKILCSPPNTEGSLHPAILYAAQVCGIDEIYLVGGAQAIAAMALGTQSIAKVDKIFGPGNSYVTEAKQQVSQMPNGAAIDMPAGPSEVLVLADANANPAFVAADLLSQAEHGEDSQAILVSDSEELIKQSIAEVEFQLTILSREGIARSAMNNARYILTQNMKQAIAVSNQYAPEHLIVQTDTPRQYLPQLRYAGSIFLGPWSPESAGDYASGTNHVLPTYGYSKTYSSLGLLDFYRRYTVQELSYEGLHNISQAIMDLADAEGLDAHKNAVAIRLKNQNTLVSGNTNTQEDPS
ncbi:histidinol dehydrogenase [Alteromonas sp. a30]|uniref:histidinol dehydrogenase n=1 Tax=Alteromonas sp. a30 TaxID=2730917 RepID=UPI0022830503|nr:histidinol dehydrogenase [Alteromonas sp. a30]MCY7295482.1 histidinol dehydrogenase [Alteromonas sp. a30]